MQPKISVIIPIYNAEKTLEKTLLSIADQTYTNLEIICINDCCTDLSNHILKKFIIKDPRFTVVNNSQNIGAGLSRNEGLKRATGTYIGFVDSDDILEPNMYELLIEEAIREDSDMVKCDRFLHINDEITYPSYTLETFTANRPLRERMLQLLLYQFREDDLPEGLSMATVWNRIYKRDFLIKHRIFFVSDKNLPGEDVIFNLQVLMRTDKLSLINRPLYHYHTRQDSLSYGSYDHKQYKTNSHTIEFIIQEIAADPDVYEDLLQRIYYRVCILLQWGIVNEWKRNPHGKKAALKEIIAIFRHPLTKKAIRHIQLNKITIVYHRKIFHTSFQIIFRLLKMWHGRKGLRKSSGQTG